MCRLWGKGSRAESHLILPKPKQVPLHDPYLRRMLEELKNVLTSKRWMKGRATASRACPLAAIWNHSTAVLFLGALLEKLEMGGEKQQQKHSEVIVASL